ncbi:4Fe-4S dicluster domain-containing protein [Caproiciproducens faecalis]|uniref:4Fe-4S dicluster domain-containing protein n=1 Tax=Caproiciproducens faecalis TaxID=2820301 RepID=A0ABS7DL88_9FIRM|nr:4Fe-4S dicluster domain-containing protein [Caproiciproducens faecalis]MBW7572080.1 4Fe-4S dicluster domain-containing protein [Caproiciproducens faecalis]
MLVFDSNVQELKYRVLKEVVRLSEKNELTTKLYDIPRTIVPGPKATMRCCIYRERAIVEERVKMAMGGNPDNKNVVEVIDIACEECPSKRFLVTETCQGCIAHRCQAACPAKAITFVNHKAVIDPDKCKGCGQCMRACPYHAITEQERPCINACKAKAIFLDEQNKADIDPDKCIRCGACVRQCPFGAIVDKSYVLNVMQMIRDSNHGKNYRVYAAVAPAIASQFSYAKIGQIVSGLHQIGFHKVVEAALGADITARKEAEELAEKEFLTTSCCPAFVQYIKTNFPELEQNISGNVSPMVETARLIKMIDKTAKVVFIGPCIAKKMEFQKEELHGIVDSVITFEELQAIFGGLNIQPEELEEKKLNDASYFGRIFARNGGVTEAVFNVLQQENSDFQVDPVICDGLEECRAALLKASKGKLAENFIEGMACVGGCAGGAACLSLNHAMKNRMSIDNFAKQAHTGINESVPVR